VQHIGENGVRLFPRAAPAAQAPPHGGGGHRHAAGFRVPHDHELARRLSVLRCLLFPMLDGQAIIENPERDGLDVPRLDNTGATPRRLFRSREMSCAPLAPGRRQGCK